VARIVMNRPGVRTLRAGHDLRPGRRQGHRREGPLHPEAGQGGKSAMIIAFHLHEIGRLQNLLVNDFLIS
jgi:hypothetical protein